jgi:hypothetical protein
MFLTFIAVVAAGFGGAGIGLLLRYLLKGRAPGWLTPVFAGGAMIAATISTEYTWFGNTVANLPEGMEILVEREKSSWWRPWTYVRPYTDGFIALDRTSVRTNDDLPEVQLVNLYVYGRWAAITEVPLAVNCNAGEQLTLIDLPDLSTESLAGDAPWTVLREDDPLFLALCGEGATG